MRDQVSRTAGRVTPGRRLAGWSLLPCALLMAACSGDGTDGPVRVPENRTRVLVSHVFTDSTPTDFPGISELDGRAFALENRQNSGGAQGIDLDATRNAVHATNSSSLRFFLKPLQRPDQGGFSTSVDGEVAVNQFNNPKGLQVVSERGLVLVANNNGGNPGNVVAVGLAARGTVDAVFSMPNLSASPWDLVYDSATDRLFVSVVDGTVAVYDSFFATGNFGSRTPDRTIAPAGAINLHGIVYDSASDTLIVTDVGLASSPSDGAIFTIFNASTASGAVQAPSFAGPISRLGNPVDLTFAENGDLLVAEKSNNLVMRFAIPVDGANDAGSLQEISIQRPESLVTVTNDEANDIDREMFVDGTDIDGAAPISSSNFLLVVNNPGGDSDPEEGRIRRLNVDLSSATGPAVTQFDTNRSTENLLVDNRGNVYFTYGADTGTPAVGSGAIGAAGMAFRVDGAGNDVRVLSNDTFDTRYDSVGITGGMTQLTNPKGFDIAEDAGLLFIADFANDTATASVSVFGMNASGNVSPLFRITDFGAFGGRPWDCDYDPPSDTLYVAVTSGVVAVYANASTGNTTPTRVIRPSDGVFPISVNLHGVIYDAANDALILSDVGSAASSTDGALYVFRNGSTVDGLSIPNIRVSGAGTNLGNPVDLAWDGVNLYVAEKANNAVLRFDNLLALPAVSSTAPSLSMTLTAPESVAFLPAQLTTTRGPSSDQ